MKKGKIILIVVAALLVIGVIGKLAGVESPSAAKEQTRSMPTETVAPTATPAPTPKPTPKPTATPAPEPTAPPAKDYVLNTNTMKFHKTSCSSVKDIAEWNRKDFTGTRDEVIAMGYAPCGKCNP